MNKIPFNESELKVVAEAKGFGGVTIPIYNFPTPAARRPSATTATTIRSGCRWASSP